MSNKKIQQNTQREIRSVILNIEPNTNSDSRTIEGYASVFSEDYTCICDRWGDKFYERIVKGAFVKSIANENDKFFLIDHDYTRVVARSGVNMELREDEKGLYVKADLPNTTEANDLLEMVRSRLIQGMSFGFSIVKDKVRWDDEYTMYRDIEEVELYEVTATTQPCYADTEINISESRSKLQNKQNENDKHIENTDDKSIENRKRELQKKQNNANMVLSFLSAFKNA